MKDAHILAGVVHCYDANVQQLSLFVRGGGRCEHEEARYPPRICSLEGVGDVDDRLDFNQMGPHHGKLKAILNSRTFHQVSGRVGTDGSFAPSPK